MKGNSKLQKPIRLACFLQGMNTPSSRFRILEYIPILESYNISLEIFPPWLIGKFGWAPDFVHGPFRAVIKKITQLLVYFPLRLFQIYFADLASYDAIVIQKSLMYWPNTFILERIVSRYNGKIVFDLDDAEFVGMDNDKTIVNKYVKNLSSVCNNLMVGNSFLKKYFLGRCNNIVVIPTSVDEKKFHPISRKQSVRVPCIGWTGSSSNFKFLFDLIPVFKLLADNNHVRFLIISDKSFVPELALIPKIEFIKWEKSYEVEQIRNIDIGVMPLRDDLWSRGKCAFKLIQYHSIAIPSVVSPVGANLDVQVDGFTGYFARTEQEWVDRLASLVNDDTLSEKLGYQARKHFLQSFSMSKNAKMIANFVAHCPVTE